MRRALRKQCAMAGADPDTIDFRDPQWYHTHRWDERTELKFEQWLADTLWRSAPMRHELMAFPRKDRKACHEVASEWVFNYGFRLTDALPAPKIESLKPLIPSA